MCVFKVANSHLDNRVCRVVISQVNQCHVLATAVNLTLADRWHSICDSFTTLHSRRTGKKCNKTNKIK